MGEIKKGKQPLRHKYVFNERGEVVNAADLTKETKAAHKYYIRSLDADGNQANEEVMPVLPEIRRKHFKRYSTKSKKGINRVSINQREFSESILHKLAKQLFSTGKIDKIYLPEDMLQLDRSRLSGSKDSITSISSCELEKRLVTPSGRHIVVDIYCLLANGKHLIVEIAATHKCTEDKISKLRELNIDTVEIDISDMILDKPLKDGIEEELLRRIGKGGEYTRWLYNTQKNRLEQFFNKLVLFKLEKTKFKHKRDGDWYIYGQA